jgi:hypothetical protein
MSVLLSPLPDSARISRRPVASPEVLAGAHGSLLAAMEQVVAQSRGDGWLRISMIVVERGALLTVNDTVTTNGAEQVRAGSELVPASVIESAGGRFEQDGSIRGTRWISRVIDDPDASTEAPSMESTPSPLTDDDVSGLRALAAELFRRGSTAPRAADSGA